MTTKIIKPLDSTEQDTTVSSDTLRDYDLLEAYHEVLTTAESIGLVTGYTEEHAKEIEFLLSVMAFTDGYYSQENLVSDLCQSDSKIGEYYVKLYKHIKTELDKDNPSQESLEFAKTDHYLELCAYVYEYSHKLEIYDIQESVSWLINETLFEYLNELAPIGCHFGSHIGDGSLFGFWSSYACPNCETSEHLDFIGFDENEDSSPNIVCNSCMSQTDDLDSWQSDF